MNNYKKTYIEALRIIALVFVFLIIQEITDFIYIQALTIRLFKQFICQFHFSLE